MYYSVAQGLMLIILLVNLFVNFDSVKSKTTPWILILTYLFILGVFIFYRKGFIFIIALGIFILITLHYFGINL